jgi:hypothetical protein
MNKELVIINSNDDFKEVFGSFSLLNTVDVIDHPKLYRFATIVRNYTIMKDKLESYGRE